MIKYETFLIVNFYLNVFQASKKQKLFLMSWCPDTAKVKKKMLYSSSFDALKKSLVGVQKYIQVCILLSLLTSTWYIVVCNLLSPIKTIERSEFYVLGRLIGTILSTVWHLSCVSVSPTITAIHTLCQIVMICCINVPEA